MTAYNIVPPQMPLVGKDGKITREWWRFFNTTFLILGGYQGGNGSQPVSLVDVYNLVYSQFGRSGPDYDREIADIETYLATLPNEAGRIARLEARVQQLESIVASLTQGRNDAVNLQREADVSRALTLGVH